MMWRRVMTLAFLCSAKCLPWGRPLARARFGLRIQKLGHHARDAAGGVLAHQRGKGRFGVVALEQRGHFNGFGRLTELRARRGHLHAAHHVATNDGEQGDGTGADVWAKLLLQHLQQIALGQVHLQHGRELVVPHVALQPHGHGERHKVVCAHVRVVGEHAFEVARLLQAWRPRGPARRRTIASADGPHLEVPWAYPTVRPSGGLCAFAAQLVQIACLALRPDVQFGLRAQPVPPAVCARRIPADLPRSKRDRDSGVTPALAATSPCLRPSSLRRVATASPSSWRVCN
jgi:hypothetical protein